MNPASVTRESDRLLAVATPNGRSRHTVQLYWKAVPLDRRSPIAVDAVVLSLAADRARFVATLPGFFVEYADEATTVLRNLAAEVAAQPQAVHLKTEKKASGNAGAESLLEPWDEVVDGAALLDDLRAFVVGYVVLPPKAAEAIALWIMHTYVLEVADYTPYLLVTSPVRECGKTTLLELAANMSWRARKTDGITAAALYRIIDKHQPTMLLDELDTRLRGDGGEALRGVLNSGFVRDGKVTICVGDDHEPRDFRTFCPKVLAGIGRVWDTVTSRSIPIRLARATKPELAKLTKIRGDRIADVCLPFRRQILRWATDVREHLRELDPPVPPTLGARQADVWRPLLAIADAAGGAWPTIARDAAIALYRTAEEESDYALLLLEDLRQLYEITGAAALPTARIISELIRMEHRPWPEYRNDRPITPRGLASLLGRFVIRPKTIRVGDETPKGYELAQLAPVFRAYLPTTEPLPSDLSATSATTRGAKTVAHVAARSQEARNASAADDRGEAWEPDETPLAFAEPAKEPGP